MSAAPKRALDRLDQRWRDFPLRTRLTTAAAVGATAAIVAVVAVAYIAVRHELRGQIDDNLRRQAADVHLVVRELPSGQYTVAAPRQPGEISGYVQVFDTAGSRVSADGGAPQVPVLPRDREIASSGGVWLRDGSVDDAHVRLITERRFNGVGVQIALPLTEVDRQLHTLALAFAGLACIGLAGSAVASWAAVRRTMRPVQTLTETAEQVAETRDLTVRIPAQGNDELGRLATSFNTMLDALERSLGAQRQLVMDASHELRTPLASLRTNVEVLNDIDRLPPAERKAVLAGIVTQLEELTGLVADVVELARGEAPAAEHEELAFDELVANAVDRARRHWPTLTFRLHTVPVAVRGVGRRLDRAVANMLDNAGKFSPAGGIVDITLTAAGELTVADRGPGVPPESLPHVFDRFYRADEARALPGSGLGLAIVQQVVEGHGGVIMLSNRDGGGAVATLVLPVVERQAAMATREESTVPRPTEQSLFH